MKLEDTGQASVIFPNTYLTKIGTFTHMFVMWLISGLRPDYLYSHALMYQPYHLPETVSKVFELIEQPVPDSINTLVKIFSSLPEIMKLTCSNLILFQMQHGGSTSPYMDIVCNEGIQPTLPDGFSCLFSVELILAPLSRKHPSVLILIGKDQWVLWLGYLNISFDNDEAIITDNMFCRYFNNGEEVSKIRAQTKDELLSLSRMVYRLKDESTCPIISGDHTDIADLTTTLARQHHQELQQKFDLVLVRFCSDLVRSISIKNTFRGLDREMIAKHLNPPTINPNVRINDYVMQLLKCEMKTIMYSSFKHLLYLVYTCILERIASLFQTEIHLCVQNSFCHSCLCTCLGPTDEVTYFDNKIKTCISGKPKGGLYSPDLWPLHVLSAACPIVPILTDCLGADIQMITLKKRMFIIPRHLQEKTDQRLRNACMRLTDPANETSLQQLSDDDWLRKIALIKSNATSEPRLGYPLYHVCLWDFGMPYMKLLIKPLPHRHKIV
ncbi:hypothetical protein BsWGS_23611 [Bradybaena similaris]